MGYKWALFPNQACFRSYVREAITCVASVRFPKKLVLTVGSWVLTLNSPGRVPVNYLATCTMCGSIKSLKNSPGKVPSILSYQEVYTPAVLEYLIIHDIEWVLLL